MTVIDRLREHQAATLERAKALAEHAAAENRSFTESEEADFQKLSGELDALDDRIGMLQKQDQRAAESSAAFAALAGQPKTGPGGQSPADAEITRAFKSSLKAKHAEPIEIYPTESRGFYKPGIEYRDTLKSTATQALRVSVYDRFIERLVENSAVIAAGATVINTPTGEDLVIPKDTAYVTSNLISEGASITESDPTLAVATLKAYKYASFFQVSSELDNDSPANLTDFLMRGAAASLALAFGPHLITGTGTNQPSGIVTGATLGHTMPTGTGTSLGSQATAGQGTDILWSLVGSLAEPYVQQKSTAWLMSNASLTTARKLKDSTGQPVAGIGAPTNIAVETLLGRPVFVDPSIATMANNAKSIVFGDISRYVVRMVGGVRIEKSTEFAFQNDLISYRAIIRLDGALVDSSAVKYATNTT